MSLSRRLSRIRERRSRRGFTIVELLVAAIVASVLGLTLLQIFGQSAAAMSLGSAKTRMQQDTRIALNRIQPVVGSAITTPTSSAIILPLYKTDPPVYQDTIRFTTTENFLDPNYDAEAQWQPTAATFVYQIRFDAPNERLLLERFDNVNGVVLDPPQPKVLARGITAFRTTRLLTNSIEVVIETRADKKNADSSTDKAINVHTAIIKAPSESTW